MSKFKTVRSRLLSVFKLPVGTRSSRTTSIKSLKPAQVESHEKPPIHVTTAEGVIPVSKSTLLSHLMAKEKFLYLSEKQQLSSFVSAIDALLYRKSFSEMDELKVQLSDFECSNH